MNNAMPKVYEVIYWIESDGELRIGGFETMAKDMDEITFITGVRLVEVDGGILYVEELD